MTYNEAKRTFHIGREFSNLHREPAYKKLDGSTRGKIRIVQDIKETVYRTKTGKARKVLLFVDQFGEETTHIDIDFVALDAR